MIINIPLQIDEATFEQKVKDDYAESVKQLLLTQVEKVLAERDNRYYLNKKDYKYGLETIINERIDIFINEHKDEIIEAAAKELAKRLSRTKKAKEALDEVISCEK